MACQGGVQIRNHQSARSPIKQSKRGIRNPSPCTPPSRERAGHQRCSNSNARGSGPGARPLRRPNSEL